MSGEPRYFLTAYGLALKHGFQGTEEEWLESLTAYGQAQSTGYEGSYEEWLQKIADPVPALTVGETRTLEAGLPASVEITGTKENPILNFGIPRGEGLEDALMRTGGEMTGPLSMGGQPLTNIPAPNNPEDAVNKQYADIISQSAESANQAAAKAQKTADDAAAAALHKSGGTMTGTLDMGQQKLTGLPDPEAAGEAVNRGYLESYVNSKHLSATVTLSAGNWSETAPYTQTVALEGILATDCPHFGVLYSDAWEAEKEAFALVDDLDTADGSVTFTCFEDKPEVNIPIQLEVNR